MAMVNMNNLLNGKDSRWLQLEVCREFQRNKCSRPDTECKFAHPPPNVEVQNGRVTACYDSIKGRCNREKPPCKYFHPPQHLKDQLLINGRNHLALKNAIMQQMGLTPGQPLVPGQVPTVFSAQAANPYLTGMPQTANPYSPYFAPGPIMPAIMGPDPGVASPLGVVPQTVVAQQKMPRSDRLEMDVKSVGSFYYENFSFPGMVPYKRPAADKSGMPVYQPTATTYQQLMQLQQPFVPVSCEYTAPVSTAPATSATPPSNPATSSAPHLQPTPPPLPTASDAAPAPPTPDTPTDTLVVHPVPTSHSVAASTAAAVAAENSAAAALAKEVAQQNYAKAVKLAAASNSFSISPLTALSYTGVSLNKHALSMPPPAASMTMPRYAPQVSAAATLPFNLGLGLQQQMAAAHQPNLLTFSRPPPLINPYAAAFLRPYTPAVAPPMLGQGLLAAAASPYQTVQQSAVPTVQAVPTMPTVSSVQTVTTPNNNNTVVLQPFKKMKTT